MRHSVNWRPAYLCQRAKLSFYFYFYVNSFQNYDSCNIARSIVSFTHKLLSVGSASNYNNMASISCVQILATAVLTFATIVLYSSTAIYISHEFLSSHSLGTHNNQNLELNNLIQRVKAGIGRRTLLCSFVLTLYPFIISWWA